MHYVLLPTRGFAAVEPFSAPATRQFLASLQPASTVRRPPLRVLDSIRDNGPKLVALPPSRVPELRRAHPGTRIVPEVFYPPARAPRPALKAPAVAAGARASAGGVLLTVVLQGSGAPVPECEVIAFTDYAAGRGARGRTNRRGQVRLRLPATTRVVERLYLFPFAQAWPRLIRNFGLGAGTVDLVPIDLAFADSRAACYERSGASDGRGVTVGVIDTGVGPHAALAVDGGANTVYGEPESDWSDVDGHGTHVAGLLAAREPLRGMAPGVRLRAYRVFGKGRAGASNFAIAKAIDRAVADGCDLLNLSLGGGPDDPLTDEAIKDARARGVLCLIAAGNEGGAVAWPGRHALALAVAAIGVRNRWPREAPQAEDVARPFGRKFGEERCFLARFSNRGAELDLAAPGVGLISTLPGDRYGVMDGTSMACPIATGVLARRLARRPALLAMPRGAARADEFERLARTSTLDLLLPRDLQGDGLPQ
ncbi:MAG: S8 family serine peptidase [Burkholderiaceae bacterium]|nr:S8 family serine peptidase [Burkholderiaceae bacterium]